MGMTLDEKMDSYQESSMDHTLAAYNTGQSVEACSTDQIPDGNDMASFAGKPLAEAPSQQDLPLAAWVKRLTALYLQVTYWTVPQNELGRYLALH